MATVPRGSRSCSASTSCSAPTSPFGRGESERAASAAISSETSAAKTSTLAPAADNNSAFHAAPALPPATTARLPSSAKNTGNRASGAIRPAGLSDGVREALIGHAPQFRQARSASGPGAQNVADLLDTRRRRRGHRRANGFQPDAEAGADDRQVSELRDWREALA